MQADVTIQNVTSMMISVAAPIAPPYSTIGSTSIARKLKNPAAVVNTHTMIAGPV